MEKVWEESRGEVTPRTFQELAKLSRRIDASEARKRRFRVAMSALAAAACLAIVALSTFFLTRSRYSAAPLDNTCTLVALSGETTSVTLEDGTQVFLNAGSSLLYPEQFGEGSRIVYLNGEGNFDVAKDPSRPFIVKTSQLSVEALGTSFCVQAYAGEKMVLATLKEGKIRVTLPGPEKKSYILQPDMQLRYQPLEKTVSLARVDASRVMSWAQGYLSFSGASFPEIASALERRFGVSVSYDSGHLRHNALNVRFMPQESLEDALDVLTLLIPGSRYKIDGDRVYFLF